MIEAVVVIQTCQRIYLSMNGEVQISDRCPSVKVC